MANTSQIKIPANSDALILFSDGNIIFGNSVGFKGTTTGEICFNTGITGYQEIITDPSYSGQIINFTFPHIGNIGTNEEDIEAKKIYAKGLIIRNNITNPSNFRSENHFNDWLVENKITGISNVDTRAITKKVRQGAQNILIHHFTDSFDIEELKKQLENTPNMKGQELAVGAANKDLISWEESLWQLDKERSANQKKYKVVVIDFGIKLNILRCLSENNCDLVILPPTATTEEILQHKPDGIFLSNGPGDPYATMQVSGKMIEEIVNSDITIFGICLGHQLLSLALGCKTLKMQQGHRGCNHPIKDLENNRVYITSQNHGFTVSDDLPNDVEATHISLFDNTIQGIASKTKPIFSVQGHPEASPGPHDIFPIFKQFIDLMEKQNA